MKNHGTRRVVATISIVVGGLAAICSLLSALVPASATCGSFLSPGDSTSSWYSDGCERLLAENRNATVVFLIIALIFIISGVLALVNLANRSRAASIAVPATQSTETASIANEIAALAALRDRGDMSADEFATDRKSVV